jgi:Cu/Ag efflux pump CusA
VIGGLLCATVATLLFVPSVFALIHGSEKSEQARGKNRLAEEYA